MKSTGVNPKDLILLELNELNFDLVKLYVEADPTLVNFKKLVGGDKSFSNTIADGIGEYNEPWIQWYSAKTGKAYEEHGVFRLGDQRIHDYETIYSKIERMGYEVGAVCPINCPNDTITSKFFIPDPWISTHVAGGFVEKLLHEAIAKLVNNNAGKRFDFLSMIKLAVGLISCVRYINVLRLAWFFVRYVCGRDWYRAIILDYLLFCISISAVKRKKLNFVSVFLNAGAHIQHHYLLNSKFVSGGNPEWYAKGDHDPLSDLINAYESFLGDLFSRFDGRLLIATGLTQVPEKRPHFYWRLSDHERFLSSCGISYKAVMPRMTRDFSIAFSDATELKAALNIVLAARLVSAQGLEKGKVFEVADEGELELFVSLIWDGLVDEGDCLRIHDLQIPKFSQLLDFVAVKNGKHCPTGYIFDSDCELPSTLSIEKLHFILVKHFSLKVSNLSS